MKIFAKSKLEKTQLDEKMRIGTDGIEIQMFNEIVDTDRRCLSLEKAFDLSLIDKYPISVIHAPLLPKLGDIDLEDMCDTHDSYILNEVCRLAQMCYRGTDKIVVVVHSMVYMDKMKDLGHTWEQILECIDKALFMYDGIEIAIENVSMLRKFAGKVQLRNNYAFDNVEMAINIRKELKTSRVGTVLDTCHAEISKMYMDAVQGILGEQVVDLSMENFFMQNSDVIKLIHCNTYQGNGYGKNHGIGFDSGSIDKLAHWVDLYNINDYKCPVTLEVRDDDYLNCVNYEKSREALLKILTGEYSAPQSVEEAQRLERLTNFNR